MPTSLQGKLQLPIRVGSLGPEVEQFCLQRNLMPSGFLVTVTSHSVQLWNFDDHQDKKRQRCRLESQVVFTSPDSIEGEIVDCAFNDKQNLLVLVHKNFVVSAIQLGKLEKKHQALMAEEGPESCSSGP